MEIASRFITDEANNVVWLEWRVPLATRAMTLDVVLPKGRKWFLSSALCVDIFDADTLDDDVRRALISACLSIEWLAPTVSLSLGSLAMHPSRAFAPFALPFFLSEGTRLVFSNTEPRRQGCFDIRICGSWYDVESVLAMPGLR